TKCASISPISLEYSSTSRAISEQSTPLSFLSVEAGPTRETDCKIRLVSGRSCETSTKWRRSIISLRTLSACIAELRARLASTKAQKAAPIEAIDPSTDNATYIIRNPYQLEYAWPKALEPELSRPAKRVRSNT